jgi:hypothetical protein
VEHLRRAADGVAAAPIGRTIEELDAVSAFLADHLMPHAEAEERALYPVVGKTLGAPGATATMSRDHVEIRRLTGELAALRAQITGGALSDQQARALRGLLYGLYAIVKLHFAKEEEVYLPLLDAHLTPVEAQELFAAMERAAQAAKRANGLAGPQ